MTYKKVVAIFIAVVLIVLGGIWYDKPKNTPSSSPSPSLAPKPEVWVMPSEEQQKWYLAQGAILAYQNREGYNLKSGIPASELSRMMKQSWDVVDHESAITSLEWLKSEGHGIQFESLLSLLTESVDENNGDYELAKSELMAEFERMQQTADFAFASFPSEYAIDWVWDHRELGDGESLVAWDNMRLINVARWSYSLGYISEDTAWRYIVPAGKELQATFESWEAAANNYVLGREFWMESEDQRQVEQTIKTLLSSQSSPWVMINWETGL